MDMSRINVTIDQLALRGFEPADRTALLEGLQVELRRVLANPAARATWALSRRTPILRLGRIPFSPGPSGGRNFGIRMAAAIGERLKP
jgi:hypothetical protein